LQWWGALTQQFQQIASNAMKDAAAQVVGDGAGDTKTKADRVDGGKAKPRGSGKAGASARRRVGKASDS
jgi:hypothetical protein